MGCRGVLFAIDDATTTQLLAARSDDEVMDVIEKVEDAWEEPFHAETDKAWDAIHRLLTDGTLNPAAGSFPLNRAILGGRHLHKDDSYIVAYVSKEEVAAVAPALAALDGTALRQRYDQLPREYLEAAGDDDREYTFYWFGVVTELYVTAARAGRAVIFTVDQ